MRDKTFTWEEVVDLGRTGPIFVVYNKVYNLTGFLHPGDDDLVQFWGTDATKAFEKIGHGESEVSQLDAFAIGFIEKPSKLLADKSAGSSGYGSVRASPVSSTSDGPSDGEYTTRKHDGNDRVNSNMEIMGYPIDIFIVGILLILAIIGQF